MDTVYIHYPLIAKAIGKYSCNGALSVRVVLKVRARGALIAESTGIRIQD